MLRRAAGVWSTTEAHDARDAGTKLPCAKESKELRIGKSASVGMLFVLARWSVHSRWCLCVFFCIC